MRASSDLFPAMTEADVRERLSDYRARVEAALDATVPPETLEPTNVHSAIRWSLLGGGKRLRPALLLATGEAFGGDREAMLATACALEMVHTYSLIHDDLPSMDDDELRRGRLTCHKKFGEATAILAGDVLQTLAFKAIAEDTGLQPETSLRIIRELATAAGTPDGMVAGQAFDLEAESREVTGEELERIHRCKTGALIRAAVRCGAIIARADETELESVSRYASQLGLLFQITDDLLDITATAADLGKTPGKDARSRKATYPALYGLEAARARAATAHQQACAALDELERPAGLLRGIADYTLERRA
jgi:geranylgeranyl pyrophosphate synthase